MSFSTFTQSKLAHLPIGATVSSIAEQRAKKANAREARLTARLHKRPCECPVCKERM